MLIDTPYTIEEIHDLYYTYSMSTTATGQRYTKALRLIATVFAERDARVKAELENERLREENAKLIDRLTPKPIETAPTDGSWVMTYYSDGGQTINRVMQGYPDDKVRWQERQGSAPTHWSPLLPDPSGVNNVI